MSADTKRQSAKKDLYEWKMHRRWKYKFNMDKAIKYTIFYIIPPTISEVQYI